MGFESMFWTLLGFEIKGFLGDSCCLLVFLGFEILVDSSGFFMNFPPPKPIEII